MGGYNGGDAAIDIITGSAAFTTPYTQGSNVGSYNITVGAGTLVSSLGYGFVGSTLTNGLTVTAKQLGVTLTGVVSKIYNGTNRATLTSGNYSLTGIYGTDAVSISNTSGTYNNKNAGIGKAVTVTGLTLTGAKAGNYTLASTSVNAAIGEITKKALIVSATGQNKVYDGNTSANVTLSSNKISGDVLTLSNTSANFNNKNVGNNKTISVEGVNVTGADSGNYTFNTAATTNANISKRDLTITANGIDKVYDGNATATVNLTDNRVAGDILTSDYDSAFYLFGKNVGNNKLIVVTGLDISGTDANNYRVTNFLDGALTSADITKRALTVSAIAQNKIYDGNNNAIATLTDNRVAGDNLNTTKKSATFDNKSAGKGKTVTVSGINVTGGDAENYTFNTSATTTANISKRDLTISANGENKVYDGNRTANVTLTDDRVAGDVFTDSYTVANFSNKNVGDGKIILVEGLSISGDDAANYNIVNEFGSDLTTANITPRTLTVSATGENKVYDGTTTASVTLGDNRVEGDDLTGSYTSANFENRNAGLEKLINVEGIDFSGKDASNYVFETTTTARADISKRDLTVRADSQSKVYGSFDPRLTYSHDELQTGDTTEIFSGNLIREAGENVAGGPYAINQGSLDAGGNYTINYIGADLKITPYNLIVTADAKSKVYGSKDPNFTYSFGTSGKEFRERKERFNGLQNGDTAEVFSGSLGRESGEHVANGPYAINQGSLDAGSNYVIEFIGADLTITPASLRVSANNQSAIFGGALPNLTYGVDGLVNGDTNNIFSGGLSTVETNSLPGKYVINQGNLDAGSDYIVTYTPGTMTIESPLSEINTTKLQGLLRSIRTGTGNIGALLSLVLNNNAGGAGNTPLPSLETASGGDDSSNPQDIETASGGDEIVSLIECSQSSIDSTPCER